MSITTSAVVSLRSLDEISGRLFARKEMQHLHSERVGRPVVNCNISNAVS